MGIWNPEYECMDREQLENSREKGFVIQYERFTTTFRTTGRK